MTKEQTSSSIIKLSKFKIQAILCVIIIFLLIFIPFTPLITLPFIILIGEINVFVIQTIIYNLYAPLIFVLVIIILKFLLTHGFFNKMRLVKSQGVLKNFMLYSFVGIIIISYFFNGFKTIFNSVCDLPYSVNEDYNVIEGIVTMEPNNSYEDAPNYIVIHGIRFITISSINRENIMEGDEYMAEYLPNLKCIVKITKK